MNFFKVGADYSQFAPNPRVHAATLIFNRLVEHRGQYCSCRCLNSHVGYHAVLRPFTIMHKRENSICPAHRACLDVAVDAQHDHPTSDLPLVAQSNGSNKKETLGPKGCSVHIVHLMFKSERGTTSDPRRISHNAKHSQAKRTAEHIASQ